MSEEKNTESGVRLSLLDVIYGVIFAYGFTFFDQAKTGTDFFRLIFAYAIIVIDWIYVHRLYWSWEYKYNSFLILDMGVLFAISRILHTSVARSPHYFFWLFFLFSLYVIWDIISNKKRLPSKYDFRFSLAGDLFGCLAFVILGFLSLTNKIQSDLICNLMALIIYAIAFLSWFRETPKSRNQQR